MSAPQPFLTFVVPVFNEERVLPTSLRTLADFLDAFVAEAGRAPRAWQLLLVDDGSKDGSVALIEAFQQDHPDLQVDLRRLPENRGKGAAVRDGMLHAAGEYVFFLDADLSTPLDETAGFVGALESGYEVVIGNRRVPGAQITRHQPKLRETLGKGFTLLVNLVLAPGVHDFTCGFKGFTNAAAKTVFERSSLDGWAFDAELVVIAQAQNLKLAQVPVRWHHEDDTKVRLVAAVLGSLVELAQITWRRWTGKYA